MELERAEGRSLQGLKGERRKSKIEKRGGRQDAMVLPGSLHYGPQTARAFGRDDKFLGRAGKSRAAPVGMTEGEERFLASQTPLGMTDMCRRHGSALPFGDGFGDDADVGEAGDAERIDDGGEAAEGNGFVAAEEDGILRMLELFANFVGELVDVDGDVAEVDALGLVNGDDEALFGDFLDGAFWGDRPRCRTAGWER